MKDYEQIYEEQWKEIIEDEHGNVNLDQVKRELSDYSFMLKEVPKVYEEVSGLTKPLTYAHHVISALNDKYIHKMFALDDLLEMADEDGKVSIEEIKDYLSE